MAGSLNKVTLIGNVGKDPEVKTWPDGNKSVSFSMATSERWKDKQSGETKERTDWHKVVVNSQGIAGVVEKYVKKGSKLYVEGKLQTRKWQGQDGKDNYTTEVVISGYGGTILLLDGANRGGGQDSPVPSAGGGAPPPAPGNFDLEDEIPF